MLLILKWSYAGFSFYLLFLRLFFLFTFYFKQNYQCSDISKFVYIFLKIVIPFSLRFISYITYYIFIKFMHYARAVYLLFIYALFIYRNIIYYNKKRIVNVSSATKFYIDKIDTEIIFKNYLSKRVIDIFNKLY